MIDAAGTHVIYEVKHLEKSFGKVEVLKDINIQIGNGEVLTIIGPSGSGKSTFLRCLNLLEKPTGGELWFNGRLIDGKTDVKMLRRDVGMVFQSFNLFPMFSAVVYVMKSRCGYVIPVIQLVPHVQRCGKRHVCACPYQQAG
mgnify:CR=1 FL=1